MACSCNPSDSAHCGFCQEMIQAEHDAEMAAMEAEAMADAEAQAMAEAMAEAEWQAQCDADAEAEYYASQGPEY